MCRTSGVCERPPNAGRPSSGLWIQEIKVCLEDQLVEFQVRHHLLEPAALLLKRPQLGQLQPHHVAKLLAPVVIRRIADPSRTACRRYIRPSRQLQLNLLQQSQEFLI